MTTTQSRISRRPANMAGGRREWMPRIWIAGGLAAVLVYAGSVLFENQVWAQRAEISAAQRTALLTKGRDLLIPAEKRPVALPIRLRTASYGDGSNFDLGQERGNVVALFFMAAWCATSVPEAQALAELHRGYADKGLRILVLDVDRRETEGQLADFRARTGTGGHLWALDRDNQVARPYRVRSLDTTIFIDREGKMFARLIRPSSSTAKERSLTATRIRRGTKPWRQ